MTPEDIIKEDTSHPYWGTLKATDQTKYQRLLENAILTKFEKVLPFYLQWQRRFGEFDSYVKSLPNMVNALDSIDLNLYERSLKDKHLVTKQFFLNCIFYGVDEIIKLIANYNSYKALKYKSLINRCFKLYYSYRTMVINTIAKTVQLEHEEINQLPLLAYIPFKNHKIGIEWMLRRAYPTMSELLEDWIILLCFDTEMFISSKFINELTKTLGEESSLRLLRKLQIHIAKSETMNQVFFEIYLKYHREINQYKRLLKEGQIVEDIKIGDLTFKLKGLCFYDCKMPIYPFLKSYEISYLKEHTDPNRLLTLFISNTVINGIHSFKPIYPEDMEYLMMSVKEARNEAKPPQQSLSTAISDNNPLQDRQYNIEEMLTVKGDKECPKAEIEAHHEITISPSRIIASGVTASMFKIRKRVIEYKDNEKNTIYYLRSVKITRKVHASILKEIDHTFTLVKDKLSTLNDRTEQRFYFNPANDFSLLLAEIERLSNNETVTYITNFPQSGEFEIPWRYVRFYEGTLAIFHPNPSKRGSMTPFYFRNSDINKSFEDIRPYLDKKCPKLRVRAVDGTITSLLNYADFIDNITQYKEWTEEENVKLNPILSHKNHSGYSIDIIRKRTNVKKSPYLSYLATLQHNDFKVIYMLERVIHESGVFDIDEFGYLFVLKKQDCEITLLYENITDLSRSSILFLIDSRHYIEAVETIRKFLGSKIKNKRQKIANGLITFNESYIYEVKRIRHTDINSWKYSLDQSL